MALGPAPFIVPRNGGAVYCRGSAFTPEGQIHEFTQYHEETNQNFGLYYDGGEINLSQMRSRFNLSPKNMKAVLEAKAPFIRGSRKTLEVQKSELLEFGTLTVIKENIG